MVFLKVPGNKETLQVYPVNYKYMKMTNIYLYILHDLNKIYQN